MKMKYLMLVIIFAVLYSSCHSEVNVDMFKQDEIVLKSSENSIIYKKFIDYILGNKDHHVISLDSSINVSYNIEQGMAGTMCDHEVFINDKKYIASLSRIRPFLVDQNYIYHLSTNYYASDENLDKLKVIRITYDNLR
jgi:hypothetical protein